VRCSCRENFSSEILRRTSDFAICQGRRGTGNTVGVGEGAVRRFSGAALSLAAHRKCLLRHWLICPLPTPYREFAKLRLQYDSMVITALLPLLWNISIGSVESNTLGTTPMLLQPVHMPTFRCSSSGSRTTMCTLNVENNIFACNI
jgi:hypothetical protein